MKSITPSAAPMSWRITANVFNAYFSVRSPNPQSIEIQIDFWGGAMVDVMGVFLIAANPPGTVGEVAQELVTASVGLALPEDMPNFLDPLDVLGSSPRDACFPFLTRPSGTSARSPWSASAS
ncbi:MAG: hypothetical protein M0C28_47070 [Candidatus Moduliflexus flocculans]|nr:hypothetical protein [Candidatus Moduliflexus flocculans]